MATADRAIAKSYSFPLVEIAAQVNPDGSLWVTERRTYEFTGAFSWATYTLERRGWTNIVDISVADERGRYRQGDSTAPGTFQVGFTPTRMEVKWHFRAEDERKVFTIRYRALGAATRYQDTAELYWRFVGTGWDVATGRVHVRARIPGATKDELRAWGHGPLTGLVTLHDGEVRLNAEGLAPEEFVEARILFPTRLVPGAPVADEAALPRILSEESRWARQANLQRLTPLLNLAMFPLSIVGALATWFVLYMRAGKEHRVALDTLYLRDPPADYPPAILGALLRWGRPSTSDFAATILDLARRGHVTIRQETQRRTVHRFIRNVSEIVRLPAFEQQALELLFRWSSGQHGITDAEFRSAVLRHGAAGGLFRGWQSAVSTQAKGFGFFDDRSRRVQERLAGIPGLAVLAGFILTAIAIFGLRVPVFTGVVALPLGGLLLAALRGPIGRRTVEGALHLAQWRAFRRFLCDFSSLGDMPPPAIAVWEKYLTYAVTLGVADRVIRQFPQVYGDAVSTYAPSWSRSASTLSGGLGDGQGFSGLSSMSSSLARSLSISSWTSSSSSGRGGGFSRGSSGGGGGSRGGGGSGGRAG